MDENITSVDLLRHALAAIRYRADKVIADAPENFAEWELGSGVRPPVEIVAHMCSVLEYLVSKIAGEERIKVDAAPWTEIVARFYATLTKLDTLFETREAPTADLQRRFLQGPLADTMTHIGQLAMIRRLAGKPLEGANYIIAEISTDDLHR